MKTLKLKVSGTNEYVKCTSDGQKDHWGKVRWFDENGNRYELVESKKLRMAWFCRCENVEEA